MIFINLLRKKILLLALLSCFPVVYAQTQLQIEELEPEFSIIKTKFMIYMETVEKAQQSIDMLESIEGLTGFTELPIEISSPSFSADILLDLSDSFPPPGFEYLNHFGRGFNQQLAQQIQSYKTGILITLAFTQDQWVNGIKKGGQLAFNIAEHSKGFIWDVETREIFTPVVWKNKRIESWIEDTPNINSHIIIHAQKQQQMNSIRTYGMSKFLLPDLIINDFEWNLSPQLSETIGLVAQVLVEGAQLDEEDRLQIDIIKLQETSFKKKLIKGLKPDSELSFNLKLEPYQISENPVKNKMLVINFESNEGEKEKEKQQNFISNHFKEYSLVPLTVVNSEIAEASKKAKSELPQIRTIFQSKLNTVDKVLVKIPIQFIDGETEWIWSQVIEWQDNILNVKLINKPINTIGFDLDELITVYQQDIFDYAIYFKDGVIKGDSTGQLIHNLNSSQY